MSAELVVLASQREMGCIQQLSGGRLRFTYASDWRSFDAAFPLSLSMPLAAASHGHAFIHPFLWGLLPDDRLVLEGWARRFHVSPRNAFSLLSHVGEDCAGAIQFTPPERVDELLGAEAAPVEWLNDEDVADRLRALRRDVAAWRGADDVGQFSLAGAQPKTALLRREGRWGVPSGNQPTTHILKPPSGGLAGHAENEHFCLSLARGLGMPAAASTVTRFGDESAIVVERYDRFQMGDRLVRVHQEDLCQALGVHPDRKYENEGGPGVAEVVRLLRESSSSWREDVDTFLDAVALNWLIAGTDAHAKNYSLLLGSGGKTRLAPLYDLASILPYVSPQARKPRLAMRVGGEYRIRSVVRRHWTRMAGALGVDAEELAARIAGQATKLPDLASDLLSAARDEGLAMEPLEGLARRVSQRAVECQAALSR